MYFQRDKLTNPEVVHDGDSTLEALADLHVDVLVEAGPHRTEGRHRGPIILTSWRREQKQVKPKKAQTQIEISQRALLRDIPPYKQNHKNWLRLTGSRAEAV